VQRVAPAGRKSSKSAFEYNWRFALRVMLPVNKHVLSVLVTLGMKICAGRGRAPAPGESR